MAKKLFLGNLLLIILFLSSCSKDKMEEQIHEFPSGLNSHYVTAPIESYPLDWEHVEVVQTPNGEVRMPWQAGSSINISDNVLYDYSSEDGWELIYSTFDANSSSDHLFFTLYNKYRGLIRTYFYTSSNSEIASSNVTGTIFLRGTNSANSPILNFANQTVVDVNKNSTHASMIQPFHFARSTWYAFDYELAYDENITNLSFTELSQQWKIGSVNISSISLNGTSSGEIKGTVKSDDKDFSSTGDIAPAETSKVTSNFSGDETKDRSIIEEIWKDFGNAVKDGIMGAIKGGVQGVATNLLNGLFGETAETTTQYVMLDTNTKIQMDGTIVSTHGAGGPNIPFPGYGASSSGIAYDKAPGVFYISNNPVVNHIEEHRMIWHGGMMSFDNLEEVYTNNYSVDPESFDMIWNPELLAIAEINNLKIEIVTHRPNVEGTNINFSGSDEQIGHIEALTGENIYIGSNSTLVNSGEIQSIPDALDVIGVRISFKVVPKNGDSEVLIVKTFKATVNHEFTRETTYL